MKKNIKQDEKKENLISYFVILTLFMSFILFIFIIKKLNLGNNIPITGSAILDTGKLNPNYALGMLILISVYAIITCSYLGYKSKNLGKSG
jgi:hypothetical protein